MDLGLSTLKAIGTLLKLLIKPCIKIGHALGLEWMLILYWLPFTLFDRSNKAWYMIAVACTLIQLALNIFCKIKGERSRNFIIYLFLFIAKQAKGEKAKGFIAKLNLDSMEEISGMVFGKIKNKYVTKKEKEDGHALVIGGAGTGKSSCVAIPTLMSWKHRAFVIDIKGELYEKTQNARGKDMIKVFNPSNQFACGYNPYYVLATTDDVCSTAHEIAESIIPLPPDVKEPMWIKNARDYLCGAILYLYCCSAD